MKNRQGDRIKKGEPTYAFFAYSDNWEYTEQKLWVHIDASNFG